jgi:hypothetical protein
MKRTLYILRWPDGDYYRYANGGNRVSLFENAMVYETRKLAERVARNYPELEVLVGTFEVKV